MYQEISTEYLRIIRIKKVMAITGFSRTTLYRRIRYDDDFPKPISISETNNSLGFIESEIYDWIMSRPRVTYSPNVNS